MAIRKIVTQGDEVLTKKCREVTEFKGKNVCPKCLKELKSL